MGPTTTTEPRRQPVIPVDSREHEPWFAELPESAKQKFRAQWDKTARHQEIKDAHSRERLVQCLIEAVAMYFLVELFIYGMSVWAVIGTAAIGATVGSLWHVWSCGRAGSALLGVLGFLLMRMLCGMGSPFHAMIALVIVPCLSMAMAIPRESGRFGA